MSNRILKDSFRRKLFFSNEIKQKTLKALSQDRNLPLSMRYEYSIRRNLLPKNSSKTRVKNRCIFTGRARSVYKKFRLSRILFRELASYGQIPGIFKASW